MLSIYLPKKKKITNLLSKLIYTINIPTYVSTSKDKILNHPKSLSELHASINKKIELNKIVGFTYYMLSF